MRALLLAACVLAAGFAQAQYPDRPVTVLIGFPPGGMPDIIMRGVSEGMKDRFPKGLLVVAKPGLGGAIAVGEMLRAAPDGYTLVLSPISANVVQPQLNKLAYRTPDDYTPILNVISFSAILVARSEAPWKTTKDVLDAARAKPGMLRVGTAGEGTAMHMALEELKRLAGIDVLHVPYKGWGEVGPALLGGHVDLAIGQPGEIKPLIDGKRLHPIAAFQAGRSQSFPDLPTWAEAGFRTTASTSFSLIGQKDLPADVLRYIHDSFKAGMAAPAFVELMKQRAVDIDYRSGAEMKAILWDEYRNYTPILKRIGLLKD
jgi:tripartite-type tricarboxylate transporter receptor subunit TctC